MCILHHDPGEQHCLHTKGEYTVFSERVSRDEGKNESRLLNKAREKCTFNVRKKKNSDTKWCENNFYFSQNSDNTK